MSTVVNLTLIIGCVLAFVALLIGGVLLILHWEDKQTDKYIAKIIAQTNPVIELDEYMQTLDVIELRALTLFKERYGDDLDDNAVWGVCRGVEAMRAALAENMELTNTPI